MDDESLEPTPNRDTMSWPLHFIRGRDLCVHCNVFSCTHFQLGGLKAFWRDFWRDTSPCSCHKPRRSLLGIPWLPVVPARLSLLLDHFWISSLPPPAASSPAHVSLAAAGGVPPSPQRPGLGCWRCKKKMHPHWDLQSEKKKKNPPRAPERDLWNPRVPWDRIENHGGHISDRVSLGLFPTLHSALHIPALCPCHFLRRTQAFRFLRTSRGRGSSRKTSETVNW